MAVNIGFKGLCAIVSETEDLATSRTLHVLVLEAKHPEVFCDHHAVLILPAIGLDDPDHLTVPDPADPSLRRMELAGRALAVLPGGRRPDSSGFGSSHLDLIPEMKRICGLATVDNDCFATPPTRMPIGARIELPAGGKVICDPAGVTPDVWSFVPKVGSCYAKQFAWTPLFEVPEADEVVIKVDTLSGDPVGQLTLRSREASLVVSNLCDEEHPDASSDDVLFYYEILAPPFHGDRPRARQSPDCTDILNGSGIGCIPARLFRA